MVTHEKINNIVEGISRKFGKEKNAGGYFNVDVFEEYKQELYLEAYTLISKNSNLHENYLAKCLWNRAKELANNAYRNKLFEINSSYLSDAASDENTPEEIVNAYDDATFSKYKDTAIVEVVETILALLPDYSENLKTFMIGKLKLGGYLPMSYRPEIEIDLAQLKELQVSDSSYILGELLKLNNAPSGGPNAFKNEKRKLFLTLISVLELDDSYRKWFEVRYKDQNNNLITTSIKAYSVADAQKQLSSSTGVKEIVRIVVQE